jgi:hypothetical protein
MSASSVEKHFLRQHPFYQESAAAASRPLNF